MSTAPEGTARTVSVLYFGGVKESVGKSEERLTLPEHVRTVADFAAFLEQACPALAGRLGAVRFAVNEAFVDATATLAAGDVVAVIPPVSGG
jgi:molybdopterin synthase sulfur carrier subunit